jgi:hypothetical protein
MGSLPSKISASRGAAVLGLSEWSTPFEVWQKIMEENHPGFNEDRGYVLPVFEGNAATRWGLAFEDAVIELAEQAQGSEIIYREKSFVDPNKAFVTCHVDGSYRGSLTLHEGKTTNARTYYKKWGEPGSDRVPGTYAIQGQHQMICTGADQCIVSVLVFPRMVDEWEKEGIELRPEHPYEIWKDGIPVAEAEQWARTFAQAGFFHQYPIHANPEAQSKMLDHYAEFWRVHVLGEKPPEPRNYDDIRRMFPGPNGTVVATEEIERISAEYKGIGAEESLLKKRKDELKTRLISAATECDRTIDDESTEAILILDSQGRKLHKYGKNKNGKVGFR